MIWADMDFEERLRTLYEAARDDLLAKQIAHYASTTSAVVIAFARANGLPIRTRVPGLLVVRQRRKTHVPAGQSCDVFHAKIAYTQDRGEF